MLISAVVLQAMGEEEEEGGREGEEERKRAVWTLLQSHDDEAIKVNAIWQTHPINRFDASREERRIIAEQCQLLLCVPL